ncbi:pectin lyase fold/virulence factor [Hyaloraphidium curvatum]|nr:pectin lyase fold/virulence factor [Hyaloraphidium curvatum]
MGAKSFGSRTISPPHAREAASSARLAALLFLSLAAALLLPATGAPLAPRQLATTAPPTAANFTVTVWRPGQYRRGAATTVWARNWGADRRGDSTVQLQRAVDECARRVRDPAVKMCTLQLTRGRTYNVTALRVSGMHDFLLEGNGATLFYTRDGYDRCFPEAPDEDGVCPPYFDVRNCTRCQFRGLSLDWNWLRWRIASIGRLVSRQHDPVTNVSRWNFKIEAPPTPRGGLDTSTIYAFQSLHPLDPKSLSVGVRAKFEYYLTGATGVWGGGLRKRNHVAEAVGPRPFGLAPGMLGDPNAVVMHVDRVEVSGEGGGSAGGTVPNIITTSPNVAIVLTRTINDFGPIDSRGPTPVGSLWLMKHLAYEVHGFRLRDSAHVTLSDLTIRSVPGKTVIVDYLTHHVEIHGLSVAMAAPPKLGGPRMLSSASDGIWAGQTSGDLLIRDSNFSFIGDDAINVNTPTSMHNITYANGTAEGLPDYGTLVVSRSPKWRIHFATGDTLMFLDARTIAPLGINRTVVSATYDPKAGEGTWTVVLDRPLDPAEHPLLASPPLDLGLVNARLIPSRVIVRNVRTDHHRARGVLLQVRSAVVEGCRFERVQQSALLVRACAASQEGTGASDVVLSRNEIVTADATGWNRAVAVDVMAKSWERVEARGRHVGLRVLDNRVLLAPSLAVAIESAKDVVVARTRSTADPAPADSEAGRVKARYSDNVTMTGNYLCTAKGWCRRSEV